MFRETPFASFGRETRTLPDNTENKRVIEVAKCMGEQQFYAVQERIVGLRNIVEPYSTGYASNRREFGGSCNVKERTTITWRVFSDKVLELEEISIDPTLNVSNNRLTLIFPHTIAPTVSFHESDNVLTFFVVTLVGSVHRIALGIPNDNFDIFVRERESILEPLASNFQSLHTCGFLEGTNNTRIQYCCNLGNNMSVAVGCANGKIFNFEFIQHVNTCRFSETEISLSSMFGKLLYVFKTGPTTGIISMESIIYAHDSLLFVLCSDGVIRVWSVTQRRLLTEHNLLGTNGCLSYNVLPTRLVCDKDGIVYLVVYLAEEIGKGTFVHRFISLSANLNAPFPMLKQDVVKYIPNANEKQLLNFLIVDNNIWTLWYDNTSYSVYYGPMLPNARPQPGLDNQYIAWTEVHTRCADISYFSEDETINDTYINTIMSKLLNPNYFSTSILMEVLQLDKSEKSDLHKRIFERVTRHVENRLIPTSEPFGTRAESLENLQRAKYEAWRRFWEICFKQWLRTNQPIALCSFSRDYTAVGLITASTITFFRPCDPAETLYLNAEKPHMERQLFEQFIPSKDDLQLKRFSKDIFLLVDCIHEVSTCLGESLLSIFDEVLDVHSDDLFEAANDTIAALVSAPRNFLMDEETEEDLDETRITGENFCNAGRKLKLRKFMLGFISKINKVKDLKNAIDILLKLLENPKWLLQPFKGQEQWPQPKIYCSNYNSLTLLSSIVTQMTETKYKFARDFALFLTLLNSSTMIHHVKVHDLRQELESSLLYQIYAHLKIYFAHLQLTSMSAPNNLTFGLSEPNFFAILLQKSTPGFTITADHNDIALRATPTQMYLLKSLIFISDNWCLPKEKRKVKALHICYELFIGQKLEEMNNMTTLLKYDIPMLNHFTGLYHLTNGNCEEAKIAFQHAANTFTKASIYKEMLPQAEFLIKTLGSNEKLDERSDLLIAYYFNLLKFVESNFPHLVDLILFFSYGCIQQIQQEEQEERDLSRIKQLVPILWSTVFHYALQSNKIEQAYVAVCSNPDPERQKLNLARFVVEACETGVFEYIIEIPVGEITSLIEEVLLSHADDSDFGSQNTIDFYEILYSFYIYHNNFHSAAQIMYEYAKRLPVECHITANIDALKRQLDCYNSALHALKMVEPLNRTIELQIPVQRTKRKLNNEIAQPQDSYIEQLTEADLEREIILTRARLKLASLSKEITGFGINAEEAVMLLARKGCFDLAIAVCTQWKLNHSLGLVFDQVATFYVLAEQEQLDPTKFTFESEDSLTEYYHEEINFAKGGNSFCKLLEYYLTISQFRTEASYKLLVADKILYERSKLPDWLVEVLEKEHLSGLVRCLMKHSKLEEALTLLDDYLQWKLSNYLEHAQRFSKVTSAVTETVITNVLESTEGENATTIVELRRRIVQSLQSLV